jgi:hypothetical protein
MIGFKDISVLSWNIWGAQSLKAKRHMMDLIRKYNPTFLVIIETHVAFDKNLVFWTKAGYVKIQAVEAQGHSGGIWILKQSGSSIQADLVDIYSNTITLKLSSGNLFGTLQESMLVQLMWLEFLFGTISAL